MIRPPDGSNAAITGQPLVMLATGGTGGHVFPAEALARELVGSGCGVALLTDARGGAFGADLESVATYRIHAGRVGGGVFAKAAGAAGIAWGTIEATRLIRRLRPAACVGFGGYASVPAMLAAIACRIPTALHEQNATLGRANRLLAPWVASIATSFAEVAGLPHRASRRTVRTGNPVRPAAKALRGTPYSPPEHGPIRLVVLGGSQGARILSDVVPAAIAQLPQTLRARLEIVQQARIEDADRVRDAYAAMTVDAEIASFIAEAPARLSACHLAICRSGASTIAELSVLGRPAILVPYPHSLDDDQTHNARAMERAGAAWLMPQSGFTPAALSSLLSRLLQAPSELASAATAAAGQGCPDAARQLAELVIGLIERPSSRPAPTNFAPRRQADLTSKPGPIEETLS